MESPDILGLVLRWLHILAGMTAVGGMIFMRAVLVPSIGTLSSDTRANLHAQLRPRWARIVAAAIGTLLVTGLINFILITRQYEVPKWYHMVWGIKFLIALVIFFLSSILAGRTPLAERFRANLRLWLNLNIFLAIVVVCLSGVLKIAPHDPKTPDNPPVADLPEERLSRVVIDG